MTYRQWVILQEALVDFRNGCERYWERSLGGPFPSWDTVSPGDTMPTPEEVDELADLVGQMHRESPNKR